MHQEILYEDKLLVKHLERLAHERPSGHFSLSNFDSLIQGIRGGRLAVITADPGAGKTTLCLQLSDDAASQGFVSVFNTLEVPPSQLVAKSLARMSEERFEANEIPYELDNPYIHDLTKNYLDTIASNTVFIDTAVPAIELGALVAQIQSERAQPVILFVDYLQIMPFANSGNQVVTEERYIVTESMSMLRQIANSYNISVFVISSVNRSNYAKKNPPLSALGASSSIEYAADTVIHLGIDGDGQERELFKFDPVRPLIATVLKNRYGNCGKALFTFDAPHAQFTERYESD